MSSSLWSLDCTKDYFGDALFDQLAAGGYFAPILKDGGVWFDQKQVLHVSSILKGANQADLEGNAANVTYSGMPDPRYLDPDEDFEEEEGGDDPEDAQDQPRPVSPEVMEAWEKFCRWTFQRTGHWP